jgi:hypothetical protein
MMRSIKPFSIIFVLLSTLVFTACSLATSPIKNTVELTKSDFGDPNSIREGSDCAYYLLGILGPFGDIEILDAIKNARIRKVMTADYSWGYYILFSRSCVHVSGR